MTNYEYYKEELIELFSQRTAEASGIAVVDGAPTACKRTYCGMCDLYELPESSCNDNCMSARKAWLNAEHIEKPKLTKKERMFCELVETGWISRDKYGALHYRTGDNKPNKKNDHWLGMVNCFCNYLSNWPIDLDFFFITWNDKEPWSVEELLKLEVMED